MDAVALIQSSSTQPELHTPRLRLRELRTDDAEALYAVHSDPRVMRYWSFPAWTRLEQAHARVADVIAQRARGDVFAWAIADRDSDRLIGTVAAFSLDRAQLRAEIGYSLAADWHGRGLAQEAVRAVLAFLLDGLGLERIEADVDPRNAPSCRLLERLGFVQEGLLRQRWRVAGEVSDSAVFGLLKADFVRVGSCGSGGSREASGEKPQDAQESIATHVAPTRAGS
jgi:RimJ/RimL family protein N-acetyltransferase